MHQEPRRGTKALSLVSSSGSAEGAEEEIKRIVELMKTVRLKHCCCERKIPLWNCAPYMYVARKVSICMLYEYDVLMKLALSFTAIFWQIQNKDVNQGWIV